ncbi:unnamed protein product [Protopolystoma xenopodis]|uniref:Uncharacterized protein n=1 Tax=Protopolystoma xenopodis TaxID=117903 RepID=A0A3S5BSU3_9PLAT|nr:unnamed protein product [Protopolystoma xenopodis]
MHALGPSLRWGGERYSLVSSRTCTLHEADMILLSPSKSVYSPTLLPCLTVKLERRWRVSVRPHSLKSSWAEGRGCGFENFSFGIRLFRDNRMFLADKTDPKGIKVGFTPQSLGSM